jgi:P pilus assembly chaperone PapD
MPFLSTSSTRRLRRSAVRGLMAGLLVLPMVIQPAALGAQGVGLDPHVVVVDGRTRSGSFTLVNPSPKSVEATISVIWGLSEFDSLGRSSVVFPSTPAADAPNAAPWLIVSPKRVLLAPGQLQEVRFHANAPVGTPAGEYWARVVVVTQPVEPPASDTGSDVRVALRFVTRATMPLFYRVGDVHGGISMGSLSASVVGDSVIFAAPVSRAGNAAYVGTLYAEARTASGATVALGRRPVAVYTPGTGRWSFAKPAGISGDVTVTLRAVAERSDLPKGAVLWAPEVSQSTAVRFP